MVGYKLFINNKFSVSLFDGSFIAWYRCFYVPRRNWYTDVVRYTPPICENAYTTAKIKITLHSCREPKHHVSL